MAALVSSSLSADAASVNSYNSPIAKRMQQAKPVRPFRGEKPWSLQTAQWSNMDNRAAIIDPSAEFEGLSNYDFLEAPDGTTWFYTSEYEMEYEEISEWYTEEKIVGYTFTIYDASFQEVGKIKDKITFAEGETKVAHAVLDPNISAKFFNTNDKYEVMVYLAMNTSVELDYKVHYYNKVYSIGGEKDGEGNDVCLQTILGRCVDVLNAASGQAENCYYTFVDDVEPNVDDYDDFVDFVNAYYTHVSVYSKAVGEAGPVLVCEKDIYMTRIPGDTTDGIYFISKSVDGTPYFVFSQYEKPYFVDPTGFASDESATEDNSLVIEVYAHTNDINLISTTKIPVEIQKVAGELNYTFYSIGSVAWKDDIDMSVNGTPQAPAFLVARDVTKASNLEEVSSSYDIYANNGQRIRTLATQTDNIILMGNVEGAEPQALFVNVDNNGQYTFNLIDLYSGKKALSLPQIFNGNQDDALTASCQRVAVDNIGNYQYVFEMRYDDVDADGNDIKRMAWFDMDGKLDRIDRINMGKDVMAASVNMYVDCLSPTLFDTDDDMEYAVLVKRASGEVTKNEFLVVDDKGDWYACFSDEDGKGSPMIFTILPGTDKNRLQMVYRTDDNTYNIEVYDLPFTNNSPDAIEAVGADKNGVAISLQGTVLSASGATIEVYNANGTKVAAGYNTVSLEKLPHGVYVVVARDRQGNSSMMKITF